MDFRTRPNDFETGEVLLLIFVSLGIIFKLFFFSGIVRSEKNESLDVFQGLELEKALCQIGKVCNEIFLISTKQLII